jgi:hypothetical protein
VLRWSDERGIARYELAFRWNLNPSMGPAAMPRPILELDEERRIR